jgi:phosphatidylserine/phosphatidylglycerophosphate/cardiolipin synthase-like enzyme
MRASTTKDGLTLRVVGGTRNVLLGIDLEGKRRKGCLGFSVRRTDLGPKGQAAAAVAPPTFLPNMLRFPSDTSDAPVTTERAPLQKFRWGDYTTLPNNRYRYQVVARFGAPGRLLPASIGDGDGVSVEITTEDDTSTATSVFFNRAAAASRAFEREFPTVTTEELLLGNTQQAMDARKWLSRGLEEAALAFLAKAADKTFALHAAIYEFQKPNLLAGLKDAIGRGVDVQVVYHHRQKKLTGGKPDPKDVTAGKNDAAAHAAGLDAVCVRREADPQDAIMHDKFVVLLKRVGGKLQPQAVWTGSMNWTDGGVYGQLNVGHAVYDPAVATIYEGCFQLLHADTAAADLTKALAKLTPVPSSVPPGHQTTPILSPQSNLGMLDLYAQVCKAATCLMVCAPFELHDKIRQALLKRPAGTIHFLLLDTEKVLGKPEEVKVQEGDPRNTISVATTLPSPLHDFQGKLLEGHESFLHTGIHIHSKIILADPFGSDPVLVTGSANYSESSTTKNDENSLLIRGDMAVCDIYSTEFMRMFEHYHFRASLAAAETSPKSAATTRGASPPARTLSLKEDDTWSDKYYVPGSIKELDRRVFAGTLV